MSNQNSKQINQHVFENGDILSIEYNSGNFAGIGDVDYIQVLYGEKDCETYGTKDNPAFMTTGTEYYPLDKLDEAISAYGKRLASDVPWKQIAGYRLEDIKS